MRMSPSAFTAIGQIACGLPEIAEAVDPVAVEQRGDDARLDVGRRGEDDDRRGIHATVALPASST